MDKTIVGTATVLIKKAKITGNLDMRKLAIVNIINKLLNNDGLKLAGKTILELKKKARTLIYSNNMCDFRQSTSTITNEEGTTFITNTVNGSGLYAIWLNKGNTGSIDDFLEILLIDEHNAFLEQEDEDITIIDNLPHLP